MAYAGGLGLGGGAGLGGGGGIRGGWYCWVGEGGVKLAQLRHITRPDRCLRACVCVCAKACPCVSVSCCPRPLGAALVPPVLVAAAVVSKSVNSPRQPGACPVATGTPGWHRMLVGCHHRHSERETERESKSEREREKGPPLANCFTAFQAGAFQGEADSLADHHQHVETVQCFVFVVFPLFVCLCQGVCVCVIFLVGGGYSFGGGLNYLHTLTAFESARISR